MATKSLMLVVYKEEEYEIVLAVQGLFVAEVKKLIVEVRS
jgi:hypothetical protein